MRVLMTGGGTGGHVYPALAIAEIIKANEPDAEIAFVGTEKGIEQRLVPKAGYKMYHVPIQGIRRSLSPQNLKTAYLVLTSPKKAKKIIEEFKPDIVIGTGGYVCWPLLQASTAMGIPSVVHESNAAPGLAVKTLQKRLDLILTNFEETERELNTNKRIVNVGNPLRVKCGAIDKESAREKLGINKDKFVLLSFGGSIGAKGVNLAALEIMKGFSSKNADVLHYHASGSRFFESFSSKIADEGLNRCKNIIVSDYIYDMPELMAAADAIVCRAGAMTLSEVAMLGKPAVLIPSPHVTDDHQYKNAKVLSDKGAAILVREEKEVSESSVSCRLAKEAVESLYYDVKQRVEMSKAVSAFARPQAGEHIYKEIKELTKK